MNTRIIVHHLGLIDYKTALARQEFFFQENIEKKLHKQFDKTENHLLLCQHTPVITMGKSGKNAHIISDYDHLKNSDIDFYNSSRGGDVTAHNPGQLVVYPILDLERFFTDIRKYVFTLEEVIIQTLQSYHIEGQRSQGETGVWIDVGKDSQRKIAAIGVKTSRWVTMHGLALNVSNDLSIFDNIIPCGIKKGVTSMTEELGKIIDINEVAQIFADNFLYIFSK